MQYRLGIEVHLFLLSSYSNGMLLYNPLKEYYLHIFGEKKRMQQDLREIQDPWTDLPLSRFLSLPHKKLL